MRGKFLLTASIALVALAPCAALAYSSPGTSQGYVSDFASILSPATAASLDTELQQFEASTTIEIAVVTVPSLGGDDISSYGYQLGRDWGVGKKDTNNGLILLVAPTEHKVRIEVGYGLEGTVTDAISKEIIDTEITPAFKANDYDGGVTAGVHALEQVASGSYEPVSGVSQSGPSSLLALILFPLLFALIFVSIIVRTMLSAAASSKHWWGGAITGALFGIFGGFISGSLLYGALIVVGFFVLGGIVGLFGASQARKYENLGKALPWYLGSSSSSSSGSSSISSGFGGGSFGGGGASGSW